MSLSSSLSVQPDGRCSLNPSKTDLWFYNNSLLPFVVLLLCLFQPFHAQAQSANFVTPNDMQSGSLLLQSGKDGPYVEAPRIATDANIDVSGPTARVRLTQAFENPTDDWVEALYVFPLPEDSAVYSLKMIVGNRVIVADIKEKQEARAIYEQAKSEGRKASLIEQQRPNVFTNAVANIGPDEKVVVQIEYQQSVRLADDRFSLRLPLVVAPRYNPANAEPVVQGIEANAGQNDGRGQTENSPIETPLIAPGEALRNPVTITVTLKAGLPLETVESRYHKVKIETVDDETRRITLDGEASADRDFVLDWSPPAGSMPNIGLFREHVGKDDYVLAYITPPTLAAAERPEREIVFVIDNSGSMGGTSIGQARQSLDYALSRLQPGDRFNVIRFDDSMTKFFPDSVAASPENIADARRYVAGLYASGGTEMLPPLHAALDDSHQADGLRQIVFLTDGEISNEQQLLDVIAAQRGRSRIFMVGIGSAPNTYLMNRAAELGRGSFTHIGAAEEVNEHMRALFSKLENPAATDLTATFSQGNVDRTPALLPDLYRGEPLVIAARMDKATGNVTVKGNIDGQAWEKTLPLDDAAEAEGISKIWARRRIADAEVDKTLQRITQQQADARILDLALEHHLVTRLTSLVAVDRTPARPADAPLTRADIPLQLPAGWDYAKLLSIGDNGDASNRAGLARRQAASPASPAAADATLPLPQTATPATLHLILGLAGLFLGAFFVRFHRRREAA